jgi:tetratricopeptide (TPR) repeat protein
MRSYLISVLLAAATAFPASATPSDSSYRVAPADLSYSSGFEKQALESILSGNASYLELFMAVSPRARDAEFQQCRQRFDERLSVLRESIGNSGNRSRQVKKVYTFLHESYLKKYELKNRFPEVFESGKFNCVSASALFALYFSALGIPYTIKEDPRHVYLIANPGPGQVMVETTDPREGFMSFEASLKIRFTDYLRASKLVSEEEYNSSTLEDLFNRYYFSSRDISLRELAGLQYYNDALYLMEEKKLKEAFYQLEKAYLLYPCDRIQFMLFAVNTSLVESLDYSTLEDARFLVKLSGQAKFGVDADALVSEFARITRLHLLNSSSTAHYDSLYSFLKQRISSPVARSSMGFLYSYERGRLLYNQTSYREAAVFLEEAYILKPENNDIQTLMISCIAQNLDKSSNYPQAVKELDSYSAKYPLLNENLLYNRMQVYSWLSLAMIRFREGRPKEAEALQARAEKVMDERKSLQPGAALIAETYSEAAVHYFKTGNFGKARAVLKKGLVYSPDNAVLQYRLKSLR